MADEATAAAGAEGALAEGEVDFSSLLNKEFKPRTDTAKSAVEAAVKTLAQQALENTSLISDDVLQSIESMVAEIDKKLSDQVNAIIHNEEYQQLES
jgi:type VI secretion system protein ImpC